MKTVIYIVSAIIAIGVMTSCKKDELTKPKDNQSVVSYQRTGQSGITANGDYLIFNDLQSYIDIVENPTESELAAFYDSISSLNYTSYKSSLLSSDTSQIEEEFLDRILNQDFVVQIGSYLYKLDLASESVLVIEADAIDAYTILTNMDFSTGEIQLYSFDDSVIEEVEGMIEEKGRRCADRDKFTTGWETYEDFTSEKSGKRYVFKRKLTEKYAKFGIYHKFFSEFEHKETWWGTYDETYFTMCYYFAYEVRDGSTGAGSYYPPYDYYSTYANSTSTGIYTHNDDKKQFIHYSGWKCLKRYKVKAWCWYQNRRTLKPNLVTLPELNRGY